MNLREGIVQCYNPKNYEEDEKEEEEEDEGSERSERSEEGTEGYGDRERLTEHKREVEEREVERIYHKMEVENSHNLEGIKGYL